MEFKIRKFKPGDEKSLYKHINDKEVAKNMAGIFYPYTEKDALLYLKKVLKLNKQKKKSAFKFALVIDGGVVGCISLENVNLKHKNAEIAFWLGRKYWGRGIMTRAIKQMVRYGFSNLKLKRIQARTFIANKASARVLEKAGFKWEGELKKVIRKKGRYYDCYLYAKVR